MSKTRSLHHIVFATKHREMTITEDNKKELYAYILGIVRNKKCHLIRINGMANHIHLLVDIHPTVAIADLVRDIKQWSNHWLKDNNKFPMFDSWGVGYYAVSLGIDNMESCRQYIINQEQHHATVDVMGELKSIAEEYGLGWYADDWQ